MKTEASMESVLLKVCFIRNRVFITDEGVGSLYFTLKSREVWKVTSQQQIFALINIPWAITCEKGIGAQQGTLCREKGSELEKKQSIQQCRSQCGSGKLGVNTEWRTVEELWTYNHGTKTMALRWNDRTESGHFSNLCPSVCIFKRNKNFAKRNMTGDVLIPSDWLYA